MQPIVEPLPLGISPQQVLEKCWHLPHVCLLESSLRQAGLGRYSFFAADPFQVLRIPRAKKDALAMLSESLEAYPLETLPDLPPFQGGAAGVLSYELGRCFERIPEAIHNEFGLPLVCLGLYDVVLAWDHVSNEAWMLSSGYPEKEPTQRHERAVARMRYFMRLLKEQPPDRRSIDVGPHASAHGLTAPQFDTRLGSAWLGNFDSKGFRSAVERAREYIYAGDIFQVNLAQRIMRRASFDSIELYRKLAEVNSAPFAGYFDMGVAQVISSSPERFLSVVDRAVETRPIKGTRRRVLDFEEDRAIARELEQSEKDRAENIMIVDLLRNDLSRVCTMDSVRVEQLCGLESFPFVHHLVSVVKGRLTPEATNTDLIAATFPGGSITGAPKVRAMEIIAELEPTVRGPYCGCMGYFGFDGSMDTNILIRTVTSSRGWWQLQVGGGITAESRAEVEEEETWTKAAGIVRAMTLP